MLAQSVVRAENSGTVAEGVVLSEKPNEDHGSIRATSKWRRAFLDLVWSKRLPLNLRAVLLTILRYSDPLGRIWWGQAMLAEQAGCSDRTLRRLLPQLVELGYLRIEAMTFAALTNAQRALGLSLPNHDDVGQAPNLLTLLVNGEPACELDTRPRNSPKPSIGQDKPGPGIARTLPPGQDVQGGPRTKWPEIPPDKMADDLLGSTDLTRNVGGDPERPPPLPSSEVNGEGQKGIEPTEKSPTSISHDAWQALNEAYDAHYRSTYCTGPMNKFVTREEKNALTTCLIESTDNFKACLRQRGVNVDALEGKPLEMLANEALRTWFQTPGGNGYLRRVSHRLSELRKDLPHHARNAITALVERHTPKPEPRRPMEPLTALTVSREPVFWDNHSIPERAAHANSLGRVVADSARKLVAVLSLPIVHLTRPSFA